MINTKLRDYLNEEYEHLTLFINPSYDNSIIGITSDNCVVYDYSLMVKELMKDEGLTQEEAEEFILYNTVRATSYVQNYKPLIIFESETMKEFRE